MKKSCFALAADGRCRVLTVGMCQGENCPFYKAQAQFDHDRDQAKESILRLSDEDRTWIAEKYFDENKLWREIGA